MSNPELLRSSHKELSKYITWLFLIIVAISCYILQRSYVSIFLAEYVDTEFADITLQKHEGGQLEFGALKFQYGAMNIFFPLVILILFLILKFIIKKQNFIWNKLKNLDNEHTLDFDPFNIYEQIISDKSGKVVIKLASYLPLTALFGHFFAGVWLFYIISFGQISNSDAVEILIPETILHVTVTLICIFFALKIPEFIINSIRSYQDTKTAANNSIAKR